MTYKNRHDSYHKSNRHNKGNRTKIRKTKYNGLKPVGQEFQDETRKTKHREIKNTLAMVAVGSLVTLGAAGLVMKFSGDSPEKKAEKLEEKILKNKEQLTTSDDIVVLRPGVKVRETPMRYVFDSETGRKNRNVDNVAFEVSDGENVVINRALIYEDDENQQWQGFMLKKPGEEIAKLRWINLTAIIEQNNGSSDSQARIIPTDANNKFLGPLITTNKEGDVTAISDPEGNMKLATGVLVPSNETNELVDRLLAGN